MLAPGVRFGGARGDGARYSVGGRRSAARRRGLDRRQAVALLCIIITALNIYLPTGILIGIMVTQNLGALHHPILIRIIFSGRARSLGRWTRVASAVDNRCAIFS